MHGSISRPELNQQPCEPMRIDEAATPPGSDPLTSALAAGKTPSPGMIAHAPEKGTSRPWVAVTCLAGVLAGLALIVGLSERTQLINNIPLDKPPEVLAKRAREITRKVGYTDPPMDTWYGFAFDDSWERYVQIHDTSASRWESLKTAEMPVVGFRYRQSPRLLFSLNELEVSFDDPPQTVSGMTATILDGEGHLLTYFRVPPQIEESQTSSTPPPDWTELFAGAGLNRAEFRAIEPRWTPPYYSDARAAWEGLIPGKSRIPVRIEAAAYRGKPIYFEIIHPNSTTYRQVESQFPARKLRVFVLIGCFVVILSGGIVLATRNMGTGRGDRNGALRLAVFVFVVTLLEKILANHHVGSVGEFKVLAQDRSVGLSFASLGGLLYFVAEPFARVRWPRHLISWSQLVAGNPRDTLVGRDLLIGCLFGVTLTLTQYWRTLAPVWLGRPPAFPSGGLASFAGLTEPIERVLLACDKALLLGTGLFLFVMLLSLILRRDWLAATAGWLLITAGYLLAYELWTDVFFAGLASALLIFCLMRFGLLSQVFLFFTYEITYKELSITWHLTAWYAHGTILMLIVLVCLALYGFRTSLGEQTAMSSRPSGFHSEHPIAKYCRDFSAEHQFLLQLLGRRDSAQDALLRRHATQIDWVRLFTITPPDLYAYLGYKLAELGLEGQCPALLWKRTLNYRRLTAAQWLRFRFELHRLVEAFTRHNVDFLLLKGGVLAFVAYPDYSLRPMSDIDLLVRPESLEEALELIYAAGFRCPERFKFANPVGLTGAARSRCARQCEISVPLQKPGTRSLIEVHTQLETAAPWFPVSTCRMWESAEEADVDGLRVRSLEKHEFLFHLVLHLARAHLFDQGLRPLLDVHLWVELHRDRLDWEWFACETLRRGYGDWVHLALKIVRDTFKTPIPVSFFDRVPPPPEFERLQHLACEQIWAERRADYKVPALLFLALSQPSAKRAILLLLRRVWPSRRGVGVPTVPPVETLRGGGLALSLRRAVTDVRVKMPKYFRAWRNGSLSWSSLQRTTRLAKGCTEIEQILINRVRV
jgi:Uncharacterised nucleotidyltransferase